MIRGNPRSGPGFVVPVDVRQMVLNFMSIAPDDLHTGLSGCHLMTRRYLMYVRR